MPSKVIRPHTFVLSLVTSLWLCIATTSALAVPHSTHPLQRTENHPINKQSTELTAWLDRYQTRSNNPIKNNPIENDLLENRFLLNQGQVLQPLRHFQQIQQMYLNFDHQLLWFKQHSLSVRGESLLQVLKESALDNFGATIDASVSTQTHSKVIPQNVHSSYRYHIDQILYQLQSLRLTDKDIAQLDILLTDAFISYTADVLSGALIPNQDEPDHPNILRTGIQSKTKYAPLDRFSESPDVIALLEGTIKPAQLDALIEKTLTPSHSGYLALRSALDHYLALLQTNDWPNLSFEMPLPIGSRADKIQALRKRLILLGDYPMDQFSRIQTTDFLTSKHRDFNTPLNASTLLHQVDLQQHQPSNSDIQTANTQKANTQHQTASNLFDQALSDALTRFQKRHGLSATGLIDQPTLDQLNITPDQRIRQIAINMKRWRYLPDQLGDRYVMANMADYSLKVVEAEETTLEMDIIIGRESRRTPILVQELKFLVLNPSWSIPPRIARTLYLPHAKKNPGYLKRRNIEVVRGTGRHRRVIDPYSLNWDKINIHKFPYRLEQKPGKKNSLGEVKYPLNNGQAIYLHDTDKPHLFQNDDRALSSGCIRVSKPRQLTEELLKYTPGWNSKRIKRAHRKKRPTYVGLKQEVPVYLMYWTAWVDEEGILQFRDDIYKRDLPINTKGTNIAMTSISM